MTRPAVPALSREALTAALDAYPDAPIDDDNVAFYAGLLDHRFLANRCSECATWHFPHRSVCPSCWSRDVVATPLQGTGSVYMLTSVHHVPWRGLGLEVPLVIATVEMDEEAGLRVSAPVLGASPGEVAVDDRVELAWYTRDDAPIPAFRLVAGEGS